MTTELTADELRVLARLEQAEAVKLPAGSMERLTKVQAGERLRKAARDLEAAHGTN